jgi:anaerobic selenocysteine-containing dehydrogenase
MGTRENEDIIMSSDKSNAAGETVLKSACRVCHGGCGVLVSVKDGKVIKVQGDPDSPLNQGRMCPKGLASIEMLYHPDRLTHPLKRTGKRGQGQWERISWDEALDLIAFKVAHFRSTYGPESIAVGQGTGRYYFNAAIRFANALNTPNWCEPGQAQCFCPRIVTGMMTFGALPVCDYYGEINPACLLVWGHNPTISGPDGEIQFRVKDCIRRGTKLIVIDPRQTELAKKADLWLQIRPGTDDALALSMINVIINERLFDVEFIEKWTVGFERLAKRAAEYPPERVAGITWITAEKIKSAARLFARTKPAALEWGVALEHTPNCLQTVRAVGLLPSITGNIDIPGGWILGESLIKKYPDLAENLSEEMKAKRMGADQFKVLSGPQSFFPSAHVPTVFQAMRTGKPYPIKAFLIFGNNGLVTYANSRQFLKILMGIDLLVVMELFMTPTAELADIVLPSATWLEADQVVRVPLGEGHVMLAQQKAVQVGECRQPEAVFVELARRLHLKVGKESLEQVINEQLKPQGMTFQEIKKRGFIASPLMYRKYEKTGFETPSGKVELASSYLEMLGYDPLPYYEEPPESPVSQPELAQNYPLILITGGRLQHLFNSEHRQIPSLRRHCPDPIVQINPQTARDRNIEDGDWVWIESPRGKIQQRAQITEGIDPRVVNVEFAWWFPEEPKPEHGVWKANANMLTNNAPPYDPAMGTYQLRALLCQVYKQ